VVQPDHTKNKQSTL